jgi:hypothetical protein
LGGEQAEYVLESPGELDEHLDIQLAALVYQGYTNTHRADYKRPDLSKLYQNVTRHIHPKPCRRTIVSSQ